MSKLIISALLIAGSDAIAAPPAGCAATTCLVNTICVEDQNGQASCITDPCHGHECMFGKKCVVKDAAALCVDPNPAGCAAALCLENTICVEDEFGQASCIADPCHEHECMFGKKCVVKDAAALCVDSNPAGCAAALCSENTICVEDEFGQASCIADPCHEHECMFGKKCVVKDAAALCVDPNPAGCAAALCLENTICVEDEFGQASCIADPCHEHECMFGKKCVVKDAAALCIDSNPAGCAATLCPANTICVEDEFGQATCSIPPPVVGCEVIRCAGGFVCEEDTNGQGHCVESDEVDVFGYYLVSTDQRRCISPLCGGHWIKRVNKRKMRCADGTRSESCYIAEITSELKPKFAANEKLLVKGSPSKKEFDSFGTMGTFAVEKTFATVDLVDGSGSFLAIKDNGIRCVTTPCDTITGHLLNKERVQTFSSVEFVDRLASDVVESARSRLAAGETVFVAADRVRVYGEKKLLVNQVYNEANCPEGYRWHKEACRTAFGCAFPQLEMTLVGGVGPGGDPNGPINPAMTTLCVDSCEEMQHTGPGTCTGLLQ